MEMESKTAFVLAGEVDSRGQSPDHAGDLEPSHGNNNFDQRDMHRMGKKQELRRGFEIFSIFGFISILQATWESTLLASSFGLSDGGSAGVIWLSFATWMCFVAMVASMAEMASMAPTAGGQYHWVSEFAPASYQKPLSYIVGWCCSLGWVAGIPACAQIATGVVQGMVLIAYPDANVATLWQTTLFIFFFMAVTFAFNLYCARYLPLAEGVLLVLHIAGFFAFLIVMWAVTDHVPADRVFFHFEDHGGWGNMGVAVLAGIGSPLWFFIGPDAGAHMSEELKDASIQLPRAMMYSLLLNGALGFIMLVTFCFCIPNIEAVLNTPTYQPVIQVIHNITGSLAATCVLGTVLLILTLAGTMTNIAAASRQCWAFARDRGFPCSEWIMHVDPRRELPVNAIYVCAAVSFVLGAINFGSDVAFNAIVSVSNAALIFSYMTSIGCIRLKRWRGEPLLNCRWSLGRWGAPLNDLSLAFLIVAFVFSFFPEAPLNNDPTWAADMNWACVMFGATILGATAYYWTGGRHIYVPPVKLVKPE